MITSEQEAFISAHFHDDYAGLRLRFSKTRSDIDFLIQQIRGRKKAREKFPFLLNKPTFIFPEYLSIEQSSSESTSRYKAKYFSGGTILDMTGGMGIDAIFASPQVDSYILCEQNKELAKINAYNYDQLSLSNISVKPVDSVEFLQKHPSEKYDMIFLDPARRENQEKGKRNKVFLLEDCQPNILELQETLFKHTDRILLKLSPMLDISAVLNSLNNVEKVVVIAVKNEVKELLVILQQEAKSVVMEAVNIQDEKVDVYEALRENRQVYSEFSLRRTYLYEPSKSLIKSELHDNYAHGLLLKKLHPNTQFYTSDELVKNFMGRTFQVIRALPTSKKQFQKIWNKSHANVISRNHPMKANEIEKRFGLKPGGETYILAFTDVEDKRMVEAKLL